MSRSKNTSHGKTPSPSSILQRAKKLMERADFKEAIKGLKSLEAKDQTQESNTLLQLAYVGRAREFLSRNARIEAKQALGELNALGNLLPEILRQAGELRMRLGEAKAVQQEAIFSAEAFAALEADLAITHHDEFKPEQPEAVQMARNVLAALEDVEKGRDDEAQQRLREIPRQSPFADWKLFVRGLSAYYRQQDDERLANWNRLSPGRAAHRIAIRMSRAVGVTPPPETEPTPTLIVHQARNIVAGSQGVSLVVERLQKLDRLIQEHDWSSVLKLLQTSKAVWDEADPQLALRLTQVLLPLCPEETRHAADWHTFCASLPPRPYDPSWNLASAEVYARLEGMEGEKRYLKNYLKDVPKIPGISDEERNIITAWIYNQLGHLGMYHIGPVQRVGGEIVPQQISEETHEYYRRAVEAYPQLPNGFVEWATSLGISGKEEEAKAAFRLMLEKLGDSEIPLRKLLHDAMQQSDTEASLDYNIRLRRLLPLDKNIAELLANNYMAAARTRCVQGQHEAARDALKQAQAFGFAEAHPQMFQIRHALFEQKLGNADPLNALLDAVKSDPDAAPSWYCQLTVEAGRYELPAKQQNKYHKLFTESMKELKPNGEAAGKLVASLAIYTRANLTYSKQAVQIKSAIAYLKKCEKCKWRCEDLLFAHEFLCSVVIGNLGSAKTLEKKYYALGTRHFKKEALFHLQAARVELSLPEDKIKTYRAEKMLNTARILLQNQPKANGDLLEEINMHLERLEEMYYRNARSFFPPPGPNSAARKFAAMFRMLSNMAEDFDE